MRVNIYSEELTEDFELLHKKADTGHSYYGLRIFLESSSRLPHDDFDDDRSAVTFWFPSPEQRRAWIMRLHSST